MLLDRKKHCLGFCFLTVVDAFWEDEYIRCRKVRFRLAGNVHRPPDELHAIRSPNELRSFSHWYEQFRVVQQNGNNVTLRSVPR